MHWSMLSQCLKNKELLLLIKWTISSFTTKTLPYDEVSIYKLLQHINAALWISGNIICYVLWSKVNIVIWYFESIFLFFPWCEFLFVRRWPSSTVCIHRYNDDDEWDESEIMISYEDKRTSNFILPRLVSSRICLGKWIWHFLIRVGASGDPKYNQGITYTYDIHKKAILCFHRFFCLKIWTSFSHRKIIFN